MLNNNSNIIDFKERIEKIFPKWNFKILFFTSYKKEMTIKCEHCGKEIYFKKADYIFNRINACACFKIFRDFHEKLQYLSNEYNFEIIQENKVSEKQIIKCKRCGEVMKRNIKSIFKTPWHCDLCNNYCRKTPYRIDEIQEKLNFHFNNQYEILDFNGMSKKATLKHKKCGTVFEIRTLKDIFNDRSRGCPKCFSNKSKGEQKIQKFLEENNIVFIPQKTFSPLGDSKYRFDFFIPSLNLAIEYQGEQHYRDNNFFKERLEVIQKRDTIKRKYCQDNGIELLEIKYTELKHIQEILNSRFNDYSEKK